MTSATKLTIAIVEGLSTMISNRAVTVKLDSTARKLNFEYTFDGNSAKIWNKEFEAQYFPGLS